MSKELLKSSLSGLLSGGFLDKHKLPNQTFSLVLCYTLFKLNKQKWNLQKSKDRRPKHSI